MSWSNEQTLLLIQMYEQHPCLYAVKHKEYHNKNRRSLALRKIVEEIKNLRPTVNEQEVQKKFLGLRTTYAAERKKVLESIHSGMGKDEVYQPSLWYYELLNFLNPHLQIRVSRSSLEISQVETQEAAQEEINDNLELEDTENTAYGYYEVEDDGTVASEPVLIDTIATLTTKESVSSQSYETPSNNKNKRLKKKLHDKRQEESDIAVLKNISNELNKATNTFQLKRHVEKLSEDIMGEFVAAQLKNIKNENQKQAVQLEIHRILYEALTKNE